MISSGRSALRYYISIFNPSTYISVAERYPSLEECFGFGQTLASFLRPGRKRFFVRHKSPSSHTLKFVVILFKSI